MGRLAACGRLAIGHPSKARTAFLRSPAQPSLFLRPSASPRQIQSLLFLLLLLTLSAAAQTQQRDLTVEKLAPAPKTQQIPVSYAVIVGISHYRNLPEKDQLHFADRDAQSIFTALISPEGGNFRVENVHMLTNEKATLADLRREIDTWLPSVAKEDDRVLIYFAGHGFMYQGKGYLAPFDMEPAPNRISATGYPMDDLGAVIGGKIKARSKILLTDACHSGAITPEDTESLNTRLGDLTKSLFSLTASRAGELSFESADLKGGHGVFTYYVVQGMEGAADTSAMAWSPPMNSPSMSTRKSASIPPAARIPPPTRPTTIPKCSWPTSRRKPGPPPLPPPDSAPSSSIPIWMASKSSSMAKPSAS